MKVWLIVLSLLVLPAVQAAPAAPSAYAPLKTFAPFHYQHPVNRYRSANGMPGPDYWQNRVDYQIKVTLDPASKTLSGSETFTYTNHSPDALHMLWLHLDQNRYRRDARGNFSGGSAPAPANHTDGYRIASVQVRGADGFKPVHYIETDTRMRIDLPQALKPAGGKVQVRIVYSYTVPGKFGGRTRWFESKNGDVFEIAQWFPRLCVYDDLRGWDTLPYLNNEFYLEYGDIDYRVTVPSSMIVVGSGKLMNPDAVLSKTERQRLNTARHSDATVMIRTLADVTGAASRPAHSGVSTWHFHMNDTRDVAFAASRAFIWDAARINLPHGKTALAMSAYPAESIAKDGWGRATQYVKYTVEYFSRWYPYPWPNAVAVAGKVGGMEYPGIVFDWYTAKGKSLFMLTVHEIGHSWFPMTVGSNERRNAWMDEGFNTFVDAMAQQAYNHGEFAPKQDGEYAPKTGDPAKDIIPVLADTQAPPILTRADAIKEKYRHPMTYFKAAYGLTLLREQILGPERFDVAFSQYVHAWAFKHPSPSDFFRAMDSAGGEDLSWFWHGWFQHNWKLDLAVTNVAYIDKDPAKGALVTVANLDKLILPATLEVDYVDGSSTRVRVPVATWLQHQSYAVAVAGNKRIKSALIDPDQVLPDHNRSNNSWLAPPVSASSSTAH